MKRAQAAETPLLEAPAAPQGEIERLICSKDWDCRTALAVFKAESGLRCEAIGDGHLTYNSDGTEYGKSYGLAQIRHLPGRPAPEKLKDCRFNLDYAHGLYKAKGWQPWSAWKSGAFKKHL